VVYIVLVDYLVSKCDSEAARGKLNSLSDPIHPWGSFSRAKHYRIVSCYRFVIVSYRIILNQSERLNMKHEISKEISVQQKVRNNKKEYRKRTDGTY
jgi:hypothetical protein